MKKLAAFFSAVFVLAALVAAPPAGAGYGDVPAAAPALEGPAQSEGAGPALGAPTPVAGNRIFYWRDANGSVVGIAEKGQLVWLEMPAGVIHVGPGAVHSGYAIDHDATGVGTSIWDVYDDATGFDLVRFAPNIAGSTTYPGRLIRTPLVVKSIVRSSDGIFRLTNVWQWAPRTRNLALRQIVKNVSATASPTIMGLKFYMDADVDSPAAAFNGDFMRSSQSLTNWRDGADVPGSHTLSVGVSPAPYFLDTPDFFDPIYKTYICCTAAPLTGHTGGTWTVFGDRTFLITSVDPAAPFPPGMKKVVRYELSVK